MSPTHICRRTLIRRRADLDADLKKKEEATPSKQKTINDGFYCRHYGAEQTVNQSLAPHNN